MAKVDTQQCRRGLRRVSLARESTLDVRSTSLDGIESAIPRA